MCSATPATLNLDAYSGGVYWTHYGPGGWYLDAVLQGTGYGGSAKTVVSKLPTSGAGFVSSLEAGYPIPLPLGPRFILEPQAQIIYQHVGFRDAYDNIATVALGSTSGATGRLGVRGQWTINTEGGQVWQPYVRANVWHELGRRGGAEFSWHRLFRCRCWRARHGWNLPLARRSRSMPI